MGKEFIVTGNASVQNCEIIIKCVKEHFDQLENGMLIYSDGHFSRSQGEGEPIGVVLKFNDEYIRVDAFTSDYRFKVVKKMDAQLADIDTLPVQSQDKIWWRSIEVSSSYWARLWYKSIVFCPSIYSNFDIFNSRRPIEGLKL